MFRKITTAEFFCDEPQFDYIVTKNIISIQKCTYEITSKQVLWLAPYRRKMSAFLYPAFSVSQWLAFANGYKNFDAHTDSFTAGDSHPIPFSLMIPGKRSHYSITNTSCETIPLKTSVLCIVCKKALVYQPFRKELMLYDIF